MILDHFRLDGQVALVTGGGTGLGQAVAIGLAEAGADVAVLYTTRPDAVRQAIAALKRRWMGLQLDIQTSNVTQLQGAVQQVSSQLGHLDILVNCIESTPRPNALDYAESDWDGMQKDLKAAFFLSQAAVQQFRTVGHGRIVNVGAVLSETDEILNAATAPTRTNLLALTRQLANQWAPLGINVNCIIPGYIALAPEAPGEHRPLPPNQQVPAGHWGAIADVQAAVVYLASSAAAYAHGTAVYLDGGWAAH